MASLLDLYRSVFGGEADQGAPMAAQNRQGGFDPYTPAPAPDALDLLYELSGGKDLSQAYKAYGRGDYLPALGQGAWGAAQAATMAYPALKAGGAALRAGAPLAREAAAAMPAMMADETGAIRAYHASPFDFNRFDLSKIGTGEGAQAYGHGLYFAENEATSKAGYLPQLKDIVFATSGRDKIRKGDAFEALIAATRDKVPGLHPDQYRQIATALGEGIEESGSIAKYLRDYELPGGQFGPAYRAASEEAQRLGLKVNPGHMYEVDIHADPNMFLQYEKQLREHPAQVQEALRTGTPWGEPYLRSSFTGGEIKPMTAAGANELREAGIPGIRYRDQGSRVTGDPVKLQQQIDFARRFADDTDLLPRDRIGWQQRVAELESDLAYAKANPPTSNYAIFDPSIIQILRKYGILPPVAAGGLLATEAEP